MKILAVETSGMEASVALADGDRRIVEQVLDTAGHRNARLLIPSVADLLDQLNLEPAAIDVMAVSIGPGSFTGLRVGIVFAKTFAWVNDARLAAVDTLQALAQRVVPTDREVMVISNAQRGDVFVNSYRGTDVMEPVGTVRLEPLDSVLAYLASHPQVLLTGPGVAHFADQIPDTVLTANDDLLTPQASALLPRARVVIEKQQWSDPNTLEPVYLRRSYAEESRRASS